MKTVCMNKGQLYNETGRTGRVKQHTSQKAGTHSKVIDRIITGEGGTLRVEDSANKRGKE